MVPGLPSLILEVDAIIIPILQRGTLKLRERAWGKGRMELKEMRKWAEENQMGKLSENTREERGERREDRREKVWWSPSGPYPLSDWASFVGSRFWRGMLPLDLGWLLAWSVCLASFLQTPQPMGIQVNLSPCASLEFPSKTWVWGEGLLTISFFWRGEVSSRERERLVLIS